MINLIKSDLYRLFKSKTYKSCAIGALGISIFVLILSIFTDVNLWLMAFTGQDNIRRGFNIGLENGAAFNELLINALGSGAGLYIIAISITSSVVISRNKSGVMKNTVAYGYERWKIYLSQLISLILGLTILTSITVLGILLITYVVFRPSDISIGGLTIVLKSIIGYVSIMATTISIYSLFATLIPNSEVISVIAICEMLGVAMIGPSLSEKINNFIPYSMIRTVSQIPDTINLTTYLINGLIVIGVTTFLGILIFNKKEIK